MAEEKKLDMKEAVAGKVETITKRVSGQCFWVRISKCLVLNSKLLLLKTGKNWKVQKTPTHRAQMSKKLRKTWDQRTEERQKKEAVKKLERQMKDEKQADKDVSGGLIWMMETLVV